jgi:cardiolipin synthase A/B
MRYGRWIWIGLLMMLGTGCGLPAPAFTLTSDYDARDPRFVQSMGNFLGPRLVEGNSITTLLNGEEIFPAMLAAIHGAQQSVTLETYIFDGGALAASFVRALGERARAGVAVHIIVDDIGSDLKGAHVRQLKQAGADLRFFHPVRWWQFWYSTLKLNHRTHRKLLIVDGRIAFVGGANIADRWKGSARGPHQWRDNHYRVAGPIVAQLQAAFVDNWVRLTGQVLHGERYFPVLESTGEAAAQVLKSSANGGGENLQLMYLMSLASARRRVCLATPYFVPDTATMRQILDATARGVRVQILLPGEHNDAPVVHQASRARWGELIRAGVEIYRYEPTMYHVKLMIVDDLWVSIGSANLDNRSFKLNDEVNLNVLDPDFAAEQVRIFEADLGLSHRVTYEEWSRRSLLKRLMDGMSTILDPLL